MRTLGFVVGVAACLAVAGCGEPGAGAEPFTLPVGPTEWDAAAPAWLHDGTVHVGPATVEVDDGTDQFVVGATGVYWMRGQTLVFTSAEGDTEEVQDLGEAELAVSADHRLLAGVDRSRGPTDDYGTHVAQLVVLDTRTGELVYRTPDAEPEEGADLADLYEETAPLLRGVGARRAFFDGVTVDLADGSTTPATRDAEGLETYEGYADTLFTDGYHVAIRGEGRRREPADSQAFGVGRLSPDRSTLFDVSMWPTPAVVYDAATGRQQPIGTPWRHFTLGGWSDEQTFFGVAERIDEDHPVNVLRAQQVVTCSVQTLACAPVSPVLPTEDEDLSGVRLESHAGGL